MARLTSPTAEAIARKARGEGFRAQYASEGTPPLPVTAFHIFQIWSTGTCEEASLASFVLQEFDHCGVTVYEKGA